MCTLLVARCVNFVVVSSVGLSRCNDDDDDDCFYIALFSALEQTHCARM